MGTKRSITAPVHKAWVMGKSAYTHTTTMIQDLVSYCAGAVNLEIST